MRKFLVWLHAIIIFLLAACLRAWSMRSESAGFAEIESTLAALARPADYLSSAQTGFCPPLFYAMLHPLAKLTVSIGMLRIPGVLAGSVTAVLAYFVGRSLFGTVAGVLAGYLLAVHPLHIYFSQEVQPFVLFTALSVLAFLYMAKSAESNQLKDWVLYDLCVVLMLYTLREALLFVVVLPVLQLCRAAFFPPVDEQRRIRRPMLIQAILLNHLAIGALALPWLSIMPPKLPWTLPKPTPFDLMRVFSYFNLRGMSGFHLPFGTGASLVLYIFFIPPFIRLLRRLEFRSFAIFGALAFGLLIPFGYSLFRSPRFVAADQAILTLPIFVLLISVLLSRCNPVVRTILFAALGGIFLTSTIRQAITLQKTSWTEMRNRILKTEPTEHEIVAFWPDFTEDIGRYWTLVHGREFETVSATKLLDEWAELPKDSRVYFVVSQFASRQPHLYTFRGALSEYSRSKILYKERLNTVYESTDLDQKNLSLWYHDPESLRLLDQPSSQTQFLFTANDPVFRTSKFEWERPDLTYDSKGRRCVWTKTNHVDLDLTVTLAPGFYNIRVHCASAFEQPEYDRDIQRNVNVELVSGADRRKVQVNGETTMKLPTSTDTELKRLRLSIDTEPMLEVPPPAGGRYGLKISSRAIAQAETPESGGP